MYKAFFASLNVGLFILLLFQIAFSTQPTIPSKKIEMKLIFSTEPDTGKECTVTLTFTPLEEIEHTDELNDEAQIYFYPKDGIEVIGGDLLWEGRLTKGKTEIIQVVIRPIKAGFYNFDGVVKSCRVDSRFIRKNPKVNEKIAKRVYEKIFRYHNVVTKHFQIGKPERGIEIWSIDAKTGEAKKVRENGLSPPILPSLSPDETMIRELQPSQDELSDTTIVKRKAVKEQGFQISRDSMWIEKEQAYLLGTVTLRKGEPTIIYLYSPEKQRVVEADFETTADCCIMRKLHENRIELTAVKEQGECKIVATYEGVRYLIKIIIENLSLQKSSSDMNIYYTINGTFRYVDNWDDTLPMLNTEVVLYYWDDWGQVWVWEDSTHTDFYGNFTVGTTHSKVKVVAWSTNPDCVVFCQDGYFRAGPMYLYGWGVVITGLNSNLTIPLSYTTVTNPDWAGAFGIIPVISKGRKYIENVVGWFYKPPRNAVYWDNTSYQDSISSFIPYIQWNGVGVIVIRGREILNDRDQWDPDIILHEYSHLCTQVYAQFPPKSAWEHYYYRLPDPDTSFVFPNLAWSEGWADFLGCAIDSSTPAEIWNLDNNNEVVFIFDLETPLPDVPYYNTYWNQTGPSSSNPFYNGYDIEGAIAEALWDIYDQPNDGNWYNYNQIWGHNNDYNQYDSWRGINAIWDVFENYDPDPSDPTHNRCYTFYEFKKGWKGKGYPFEGHSSDILCAHNLDPTANNAPNIAGDANSDGSVTIADVVYLVNYLFKRGAPPDPLWKGDANGGSDCKVNIADIVYLVSFLFKSGPTPICNGNCWACRC